MELNIHLQSLIRLEDFVKALIKENTLKIFYIETPSNPLLGNY